MKKILLSLLLAVNTATAGVTSVDCKSVSKVVGFYSYQLTKNRGFDVSYQSLPIFASEQGIKSLDVIVAQGIIGNMLTTDFPIDKMHKSKDKEEVTKQMMQISYLFCKESFDMVTY